MNQSQPQSPYPQHSTNEPITDSEEFAQTQPMVDRDKKQQGLDLNDTAYLTDLAGVEPSELKEQDMKTIMEQRDQERWQLDPDSAEDH